MCHHGLPYITVYRFHPHIVPWIGTVVNSGTIINNVSFILMLIGTELVVYVYMMYVAGVHIFLIENIIMH